jgi:hypothetical protein
LAYLGPTRGAISNIPNQLPAMRDLLGTSTQTKNEAIDAALDPVVFRKDILKSLEKVAGKGGVEKVF